MAKDDGKWEDEVPEFAPYFDPAGVYRAKLVIQIEQYGRMEEQGSSGKKEMVPIEPPVQCYNSNLAYETLPVDGVNIVGIALLKAQEAIQGAGMIVRTPIESDPKYQSMVAMLNTPAIPDAVFEMLVGEGKK